MKRNIDKIKELEHELGRYRKKQRDDAARIRELQKALDEAAAGIKELNTAVDSVLGQVCRSYGTLRDDGAMEITLPLVSVRRTMRDYRVHSQWGADNGSITVTALPRKECGDAEQ